MFKKLFSREKSNKPKQKVVVVSGLPRSGTSMMMKMLAEGGLSIVTDSEREADEDNPNGYFEIELSKKLKDGVVDWIYDAPGKVVKVISYLLEFLPADLTYDIIFMDREIPEILASQKKMLEPLFGCVVAAGGAVFLAPDDARFDFNHHSHGGQSLVNRHAQVQIFL